MKKTIITILLIGLMFSTSNSQNNINSELIQFTGIVVTNIYDTAYKVPFVTVNNLSRYSNSYSNTKGLFSLVVKRGDTIEFSCIGYKTNTLVVPTNIKGSKFFANHLLERESIKLSEVVIVPWKNVEELRRAFVDLELNDRDVIIAYQNMQYYRMTRLQETMKLSPNEAYRHTLTHQNVYNNKGAVMLNNNILNPLAWHEFIDKYIFKNKKKKNKNLNKY